MMVNLDHTDLDKTGGARGQGGQRWEKPVSLQLSESGQPPAAFHPSPLGKPFNKGLLQLAQLPAPGLSKDTFPGEAPRTDPLSKLLLTEPSVPTQAAVEAAACVL